MRRLMRSNLPKPSNQTIETSRYEMRPYNSYGYIANSLLLTWSNNRVADEDILCQEHHRPPARILPKAAPSQKGFITSDCLVKISYLTTQDYFGGNFCECKACTMLLIGGRIVDIGPVACVLICYSPSLLTQMSKTNLFWAWYISMRLRTNSVFYELLSNR